MSKQKFLKPKPKQDSPSWKKRNEARSVLQEQHAKRLVTYPAANAIVQAEAAERAGLVGHTEVNGD